MPIEVKNAIIPMAVSQIPPGVIYAMPNNDGWIYAMNGSHENGDVAVIFGSVGTQWDTDGAGFVQRSEIGHSPAYRLDGAYIEPIWGAMPFPLTERGAGHGAVVVDERGDGFLHIGQTPMPRTYWSLSTGVAGRPEGEGARYNSWRIMWKPELAERPVEIYAKK